uniref:Uncharacterized protein n=1 Tax=Panagrolaimus sp. PS1159 TaxID=55785 RepID=A0AC35FZM8_9BILA
MKQPPIPPRIRNYENIEVIRPKPSAPSAPDASSCGSGAHVFDRISMNSNHSGPPGIYPSDFIIAMELQNEEAAVAFHEIELINYGRELQMQELNNQQATTAVLTTTTLHLKRPQKSTICLSLLASFALLLIIGGIITFLKNN